jgi:catechol 2,3-dioxygenase-like lactoylglutathione lyase family enzyme
MWKPIICLALATNCFAQAPLVKGVGNFIHNVANLDASVHFYRDLLGMDMPRPPGDWQETDAVLKLYGAIGGKFRVAQAQIAGVNMRMELAEFQGVDRKPVQRKIGESGTSILMLTAVDLQPVIDRMSAANVPLTVKLKEGCDGRGIAVQDPDGFLVLVVERSPKEAAPANGKNFTSLKFGFTVGSDDILNGPMTALKLTGAPAVQSCASPVVEAVLGATARTVVKLPDGFEISLVKSTSGKPDSGATRPQDPGAGVLRLSVTDAEAAVQALAQVGVKIASAGGVIQSLPPSTKAAILKAPDGLFIQVIQ